MFSKYSPSTTTNDNNTWFFNSKFIIKIKYKNSKNYSQIPFQYENLEIKMFPVLDFVVEIIAQKAMPNID